MAQANVKGQVLADLPDQTDEAGQGFRLAKFLFIEKLGDRAHRPLRWPFDDHASEEIGAMLTGELRDAVEVYGPPIPALRHDAGQACAELRGPLTVGQQYAELGCNTGTGLVLKAALSQHTFEECAGLS